MGGVNRTAIQGIRRYGHPVHLILHEVAPTLPLLRDLMSE